MRADLEDLRKRIDLLDESLVRLLNARAACALEIGRVKRHMHVPIYQPDREAEVLAHVQALNTGPLDQPAIKRLFERIIDEARHLERVAEELAESAGGEHQSGPTERSTPASEGRREPPQRGGPKAQEGGEHQSGPTERRTPASEGRREPPQRGGPSAQEGGEHQSGPTERSTPASEGRREPPQSGGPSAQRGGEGQRGPTERSTMKDES